MNKILSLLKNLPLILFGLVAGLILSEAALRVYNPFKYRIRGKQIDLPRNLTYRWRNRTLSGVDREVLTTRNALGFRGPNLSENSQNVFKIITVGGSTTESMFITDGKSWPELLHRSLKKEFPAVWLNNAGIEGHSTYGHQLLMRSHLLPLKPNMILFLVGINEIGRSDLGAPDNRTFLLKRNRIRDHIKYFAMHSDVVHFGLHLYRLGNSRRLFVVHDNYDLANPRRLGQSAPINVEHLKTEHGATLEGYGQRLKELMLLCVSNKISPLLITHPALYSCSVDAATDVELGDILIGSTSSCERWRTLELYNDVTRNLAKNMNIPLIDLAALLEKDSSLYYDWVHYTNKGSKRVAKILAEPTRAAARKLIQPDSSSLREHVEESGFPAPLATNQY